VTKRPTNDELRDVIEATRKGTDKVADAYPLGRSYAYEQGMFHAYPVDTQTRS
jgi:hypothetical protein